MKLKSVSTYCQSAMSAGLIYTRDESGEIIRQHLVCRQMIVPLDGMPVISGDQLPALLDVPEEKRDAWFVSRIERDEGTGKELSWMLECLANEAARVVRERGKDERAEGR